MTIHEAMMARTKEKPFITRESWEKIIAFLDMKPGVYIHPTDTPEGCMIYGPTKKVRAAGGNQPKRTFWQGIGKQRRETETK